MEITLVLRSKLHEEASGAIFIEDDTDIEKVCSLLRRMGGLQKDIKESKPVTVPEGVAVLSVRDDIELN